MMAEQRASQDQPQANTNITMYNRMMEQWKLLMTLEEQARQEMSQDLSKVGAMVTTVQRFGMYA
jgi:hypothetical protein